MDIVQQPHHRRNARRPKSGHEAAKLDIMAPGRYNAPMQYREFASLVREALAHLYDISFLNRHPLSTVLAPDARPGAGGQHVHRALLEGIEQLRPPERVSPASNAWRPYLALSLRYAEEKTMDHIAQELGLSPRQLRREHARGLDMLTTLLWEKCAEGQTQSPTSADCRSSTES